jgi:hypothetical protein
MTDIPDRDLVASYLTLFPADNMAAIAVLGDIGAFCGDQQTTARAGADGHIDPMAMGIAEGRRQVWNHILAMLNISTSPAWQIIERNRQMRKAAANG